MADGQLAGLGSRAGATIVDLIVLGIAGYVIAVATGSTTASGFQLTGTPALLWFGIGLAYYVVLEKEYGQTLGKRVVGIEVVSEDGGPIDYEASVIRNLLRIVDGFFFYLVGAIAIYASDDQQRLGDSVGDTLVVDA